MRAAAIMGVSATRVVRDRARVASRAVATVLVLLTIAGCASFRNALPRFAGGTSPEEYTSADLHSDLVFFVDRYSSAIIATADRIAQRSTDRGVRRATVLWKLRLLPVMQELAFLDEPQQAYANVLALTLATRRYVETGEGASLFGDQQRIAVDVSRQLEAEILEIGRKFVPEQQLDRKVSYS